MSELLSEILGSNPYYTVGPVRRVFHTAANLVRWAALFTCLGFGWQFGQNLAQIVTYLVFR